MPSIWVSPGDEFNVASPKRMTPPHWPRTLYGVEPSNALGVEESEVAIEASFTNDLGADSLDTVELIMEFEKEFDISIPDDQAEKIQTVGEAISYIEENKK